MFLEKLTEFPSLHNDDEVSLVDVPLFLPVLDAMVYSAVDICMEVTLFRLVVENWEDRSEGMTH